MAQCLSIPLPVAPDGLIKSRTTLVRYDQVPYECRMVFASRDDGFSVTVGASHMVSAPAAKLQSLSMPDDWSEQAMYC